ncbi:NAD-dependent malic enzyme 59 kDa isoform, mitochondrial-like [Camellia sinensis]|uniref:NAD-dependent malic enzyme 59 kDa isoform, mitochondrial-like n=1 Tax=Camellia sinensis TaxID=4442 RepID=UPI001036E598|nr:NAD-dependent malic enzyme 59 kDa isoform, mitochondrial-like [Camellia sinensis]
MTHRCCFSLHVLIDNIEDFAPIIYTPTVGLVCQNYSGLFRRPRGMYFSAKDKGEKMSAWSSDQMVDMIVLTDGSRILGLGDLGVQGTGIPIGKLDMYVAAAGINPQRILPVMLDVGTNNQKLLEDHLSIDFVLFILCSVTKNLLSGIFLSNEVVVSLDKYLLSSFEDLGLRQPWLEGEEYLSIVDEFMEFEDFQMKWAFERLQWYQKRFCMFNNDIQGTASVALAGLLGTVRAQDLPLTDFVNQKIVVVGAGSAGLGVFNMAAQGCFKNGRSWSKSCGLITTERKGVDPAAALFAKAPWEIEGLGLRERANLVKVVKKVKPYILLGLSGVGGVLNEQVLKAMRESYSPKPAIFAMSNLTVNGLEWEALLLGARLISNGMLQAASECLASSITDEEIQSGILYPPTRRR